MIIRLYELKRINMYHFLDFEKSISVLEGKIEELRNISSKDGLNIGLRG